MHLKSEIIIEFSSNQLNDFEHRDDYKELLKFVIIFLEVSESSVKCWTLEHTSSSINDEGNILAQDLFI